MRKGTRALKRCFIPHEGNDYKPAILRASAVAFVCAVALVVEGIFLFGASSLIPRSELFGEIVLNALVAGTNQARIGAGLPALREDPLLDLAAKEKANDMVKNGYFAHTSPSGVTPWYWFANAGYDFTAAGENLAVNFTDSADVTEAWMNSPDHRANILNASYEDIGMATAQGEFRGHPAVYVVELFGAPAPALGPVATFNPVPVANAAGTAAVRARVSAAAAVTPSATTSALAARVPAVSSAGATIYEAPLNVVQIAAADPRRTVDTAYFAIALLFAIALILNIFIKIRIQFPKLIFGGMLVILLAGLLIVMNQHYGTVGIVVL